MIPASELSWLYLKNPARPGKAVLEKLRDGSVFDVELSVVQPGQTYYAGGAMMATAFKPTVWARVHETLDNYPEENLSADELDALADEMRCIAERMRRIQARMDAGPTSPPPHIEQRERTPSPALYPSQAGPVEPIIYKRRGPRLFTVLIWGLLIFVGWRMFSQGGGA